MSGTQNKLCNVMMAAIVAAGALMAMVALGCAPSQKQVAGPASSNSAELGEEEGLRLQEQLRKEKEERRRLVEQLQVEQQQRRLLEEQLRKEKQERRRLQEELRKLEEQLRRLEQQLAKRALIDKYIGQAKSDAQRAVNRRLSEIQHFFQDARDRAPHFAADALSLRSKWTYIITWLPGVDDKKHQRFLHELFERHIFAPKDVEQVLKQTTMLIMSDLREIENRMLVDLQADLEKLPRVPGVSVPNVHTKVLDEMLKQRQADIGLDMAADLVLTVASEAMTFVALRLATTSGLLGAGAAASGPTWGVSLIGALLVDWLLSWIYDKAVDPKGQIAEALQRSLTELEKLMLEGHGTQRGLRDCFNSLVNQWAEQYREALREVIMQP